MKDGPKVSCITKDEIESLRVVSSDLEWNAACDAIKSSHGGGYPSDWFRLVVMSGFAAQVFAGFTS